MGLLEMKMDPIIKKKNMEPLTQGFVNKKGRNKRRERGREEVREEERKKIKDK